jgi:cytidylate kinase
MYRAMTWLALQRGVDVHDGDALVALADGASIAVHEAPAGATEPTIVLLDGDDATPHLRDRAVEDNVSLVSRVPGVRAALVRIQRDLAKNGQVVMAGRDIGTVVLPEAELKVYLDAASDVRAERRARQARESGAVTAEQELSDLARRDTIDSTRETSPLTAAPDAVIINTDNLSIEEVVRRILHLAAE